MAHRTDDLRPRRTWVEPRQTVGSAHCHDVLPVARQRDVQERAFSVDRDVVNALMIVQEFKPEAARRARLLPSRAATR